MNQEQRNEYVSRIVSAMLEAIRDCGETGMPSGHLYAAMMGTGMSLEQYEVIVGGLISLKQIRRSGHVLYYVGKR